MSYDNRPILIAGPTASGKSALALELAERLGGVIINADSMQVYAELQILTARPTADEEARVLHALYGFVPASEAYSAGRFVKDAAAAIADARAKDLRPIIVGGTGLYFKALTEGLSPIPEVDPAVRQYWRDEAQAKGAGELYIHLTMQDPETAGRLNPTDTQRIVRALEVLQSSGKPLSYWQAQKGTPVVDLSAAHAFALMPERGQLYLRADARFDQMIETGALEEAGRLQRLGLDPTLPAMRALGVAPLIAHMRGGSGLEEAVAIAKAETRQYIKRQTTWLKRYMIAWSMIKTKDNEINLVEVMSFIQS
jgi:tRNA dimethylallyltransferase